MAHPPKWTTDEWLLALDFYLKHEGRVPSKVGAEIKELSETLRQLRGSLAGLPQTFRNPDGVFLQVAQFAGLDPSHDWKGTRPSKLAREVWENYAEEKAQVRKIADKIRAMAKMNLSAPPVESLGVSEAREGRLLTYAHVRRERNPKLVKEKKEKFQDENDGRLFCEVCAFDYQKRYGVLGKGFIEAHHLRPLSELSPEGETIRLEDLALLCASCHRMIHRPTPWLTPAELQTKLITRSE